MSQQRARIIAQGKVQGVGFRYFVYTTANSLGLKGYTMNLKNGDVETVVEGSSVKINELVNIIQKGNSLSEVENVIVEPSSYRNEFTEFEVRK